jgi:hypothetical protein
MGFFDIFKSDYLNTDYVYGIQLGEKDNTKATSPISKLVGEAKRVKKENLKLCYLRDDVCYNGVNLKAKLIVPTNYKFICLDSKGNRVTEDEDYLTTYGEKIHLQEVLTEAVSDALKGGLGWIEQLRDTNGTLVSQRAVDMESMDYLRDMNDEIIYDDTGLEPLAYVQYVSELIDIPKDRDPSLVYGISTNRKCMLIWKDEIFPLSLNRDEIGIIEPQYDIIRQKISNMKMAEKMLRKRANPRYHIQVGNQDYRPGPNERAKIKKEFQTLGADEDIVSDWYVNVTELGTSVNTTSLEREDRYIQRQCTCMGIPPAYVTGTALGEGQGYRALTNDLRVILFKTIEPMRSRVSDIYLQNTIPHLNHKFKSVKQYIEWENLALDDLESQSIRLQRYSKCGVIMPDDGVEKHIRELERLPPIDEETRRNIVVKPLEEAVDSDSDSDSEEDEYDDTPAKELQEWIILHSKNVESKLDKYEKTYATIIDRIDTLEKLLDSKLSHLESEQEKEKKELDTKKKKLLDKLLREEE